MAVSQRQGVAGGTSKFWSVRTVFRTILQFSDQTRSEQSKTLDRSNGGVDISILMLKEILDW